MLVNLAQANKWSGNAAKCKELLDQQDWSAAAREFSLAVAVLNNRWREAAEIMKAIGADGELPKRVYSEWPIFREFRKTVEFTSAYSDIFGEAFTQPDIQNLKDLAAEARAMNSSALRKDLPRERGQKTKDAAATPAGSKTDTPVGSTAETATQEH